MNRIAAWLLAGAAALSVGVANAADRPKREKLTLQAQRAGWLFGMYIGEEDGHPYPAIFQVDPDSEAKIKGARPGDELIRFQDREITSLKHLFDDANRIRPGKDVVFWVRRGVQTIRIQIRAPSDPANPAPKKESAKKSDEKAKKDGDKDGDKSDVESKKKTKKRPPVVIKPIPAEGD